MTERTIEKIITGSVQYDGAGVKLVRVFGYGDTGLLDPFLMMDAFDSKDPEDYIKGFPWHPHRGIETVTYLVEGDIEHSDSLGNKGSILDGCCQWMTAGSGILHQEMPKPSKSMLGVQLWLNLPQENKMTKPEYRDITEEMIPKIKEEKATVRVISGEYKGNKGSTQGDYVKASFYDIELEPDALWSIEIPKEERVFVYVLQGEGAFGENDRKKIEAKHGIVFNFGDRLTVRTETEKIRFLLVSGKPLKEPIAWGGPIVMNTQEELRKAFKELDDGTFIK